MGELSHIASVFTYFACGIFILGSIWQFVHWRFLPGHIKWTLYPVPKAYMGQLMYITKEIITFETLYRFNRRLWIGSFTLHMALMGFFVCIILYAFGLLSGYSVRFFLSMLLCATAYVLLLRMFDRNLRVLSTFEEYFNLIFLLVVTGMGLTASFNPDGFSPRSYLLCLLTFKFEQASLFRDHYLAIFLGDIFLIYLPWSKMSHYIRKYFTYHDIKWQEH